jgi:Zn-dependent protease with chaperone function
MQGVHDLRPMNPEGYPGTIHGGPGGARGVSCRVLPRGDGLEARPAGAAPVVIPYAGMKVTPTGVDDRYLSFEGKAGDAAARVLVADREIVGHIRALGAPRAVVDQLEGAARTRTRRKAGGLALALALLGIVVVLALLAWAGLGWAVERAVAGIPPEWERELGRMTAAEILSGQQVCADPAVDAAVQELARRLVGAVGASPWQWRVRVLDAEEINAFALPGGYVFVNRGLIDRAADAHEVAGVLAHEIQHVVLRHGLKNLARELGLMLVVYAVVGDVSSVEGFLAGNAASLTSLAFSRDQEREADAGGIDLMYRAGLDPTGLARFMRILEGAQGAAGAIPSFLTTHPDSLERASELTALIAARGPAAVTPLAADWKILAGRCTPVAVTDPDAI